MIKRLLLVLGIVFIPYLTGMLYIFYKRDFIYLSFTNWILGLGCLIVLSIIVFVLVMVIRWIITGKSDIPYD